ncbi:unnamed protein product [Vitrella brassicaformis CCMP3155]|uniref:Uncharacterized protein n=2 Tax=Vitrella brassicaformis TaxID=1169539 RepID=A0A0G4ELQ5_VITBC|nr:unnamed protein product [Vitrella brassicaformis CCMP3155]|eukprot:CEL97763.1 unnamed protein product [Vitrella brassicaformis CCMP3155]
MPAIRRKFRFLLRRLLNLDTVIQTTGVFWRRLFPAYLALLLDIISTWLIQGIGPFFIPELGGDPAYWLPIMQSVLFAATMVGMNVNGVLVDVLPPYALVQISVLGTSISVAVAGVVTQPWMFVATAALVGATACTDPVVGAMVFEAIPDFHMDGLTSVLRAQFITYKSVTKGMGFILGPLLAILISPFIGYSLTFFSVAGLGGVLFILLAGYRLAGKHPSVDQIVQAFAALVRSGTTEVDEDEEEQDDDEGSNPSIDVAASYQHTLSNAMESFPTSRKKRKPRSQGGTKFAKAVRMAIFADPFLSHAIQRSKTLKRPSIQRLTPAEEALPPAERRWLKIRKNLRYIADLDVEGNRSRHSFDLFSRVKSKTTSFTTSRADSKRKARVKMMDSDLEDATPIATSFSTQALLLGQPEADKEAAAPMGRDQIKWLRSAALLSEMPSSHQLSDIISRRVSEHLRDGDAMEASPEPPSYKVYNLDIEDDVDHNQDQAASPLMMSAEDVENPQETISSAVRPSSSTSPTTKTKPSWFWRGHKRDTRRPEEPSGPPTHPHRHRERRGSHAGSAGSTGSSKISRRPSLATSVIMTVGDVQYLVNTLMAEEAAPFEEKLRREREHADRTHAAAVEARKAPVARQQEAPRADEKAETAESAAQRLVSRGESAASAANRSVLTESELRELMQQTSPFHLTPPRSSSASSADNGDQPPPEKIPTKDFFADIVIQGGDTTSASAYPPFTPSFAPREAIHGAAPGEDSAEAPRPAAGPCLSLSDDTQRLSSTVVSPTSIKPKKNLAFDEQGSGDVVNLTLSEESKEAKGPNIQIPASPNGVSPHLSPASPTSPHAHEDGSSAVSSSAAESSTAKKPSKVKALVRAGLVIVAFALGVAPYHACVGNFPLVAIKRFGYDFNATNATLLGYTTAQFIGFVTVPRFLMPHLGPWAATLVCFLGLTVIAFYFPDVSSRTMFHVVMQVLLPFFGSLMEPGITLLLTSFGTGRTGLVLALLVTAGMGGKSLASFISGLYFAKRTSLSLFGVSPPLWIEDYGYSRLPFYITTATGVVAILCILLTIDLQHYAKVRKQRQLITQRTRSRLRSAEKRRKMRSRRLRRGPAFHDEEKKELDECLTELDKGALAVISDSVRSLGKLLELSRRKQHVAQK